MTVRGLVVLALITASHQATARERAGWCCWVPPSCSAQRALPCVCPFVLCPAALGMASAFCVIVAWSFHLWHSPRSHSQGMQFPPSAIPPCNKLIPCLVVFQGAATCRCLEKHKSFLLDTQNPLFKTSSFSFSKNRVETFLLVPQGALTAVGNGMGGGETPCVGAHGGSRSRPSCEHLWCDTKGQGWASERHQQHC